MWIPLAAFCEFVQLGFVLETEQKANWLLCQCHFVSETRSASDCICLFVNFQFVHRSVTARVFTLHLVNVVGWKKSDHILQMATDTFRGNV